MRSTKGAISMLLAAYRSIFKSAYIKGLASTVALTSLVAAGSVQAADFYATGVGNVSSTQINKVFELNDTSSPTLSEALEQITGNSLEQEQEQKKQSSSIATQIANGVAHVTNNGPVTKDGDNVVLKYVGAVGALNIETKPADKAASTDITVGEGTAVQPTATASGGNLKIGKGADDDLALSLTRAKASGLFSKYTGGYAYGGFAKNTSGSVTATQNTVTIKDGLYADGGITGGMAVLTKSGKATASDNTVNYFSTVVKQANEEAAGTSVQEHIIAGGIAIVNGTEKTSGSSATATGNVMNLGSADNKDMTDASVKPYIGGGYAVNKNQSGDGVISVTKNTANLTKVSYKKADKGYLFGGYVWNNKDAKSASITISENTINLLSSEVSGSKVVIAGALGDIGSAQKDQAAFEAKDNTVVIGDGSKVSDTTIYGALLNNQAKSVTMTGNKVRIAAGGSVTNSDIYGAKIKDGQSVDGATLKDNAIEIAGAYTVSKNTHTLSADTITLQDGGVVTASGGTVKIASGASFEAAAGSVVTDKAENSKVEVAGTMILKGATLNNAGTLAVDQNAELKFTGDYDLSGMTGTVSNAGKISISAATVTVSDLSQLGYTTAEESEDEEIEAVTLTAAAAGNAAKLYVQDKGVLSIKSAKAVTMDAAKMDYITGVPEGTVTTTASDGFVFDLGGTTTLKTNGVTYQAGKMVIDTSSAAPAEENLLATTAEEAKEVTLEGYLNVSDLDVAEGTSLKVAQGTLTFSGASSTFANDLNIAGNANNAAGAAVQILNNATLGNVTLTTPVAKTEEGVQTAAATTSYSYLNVAKTASASVKGFKAASGTQVNVAGVLTVNGKTVEGKDDDLGVDYEDGVVSIAKGGTFALSNAVVSKYITAKTTGATEDNAFDVNASLGKVKVEGGTLQLAYTSAQTITDAIHKELKSKLFTTGSTGVIDYGSAKLDGAEPDEKGEISIDAVTDGLAGNGATSEALKQATVVSDSAGTSSAPLTTGEASVGSMSVSTEAKDVYLAGSWTFNAADQNTAASGSSNAFVANKKGEAMNINSKGDIGLVNGGKAGDVTSEQDVYIGGTGVAETGKIKAAAAEIAGTASTAGIEATTVTITGAEVSATNASGDAVVKAATLSVKDASLTADAVTVGATGAEGTASVVEGGSHDFGKLTIQNAGSDTSNTLTIAGDATVVADSLTGAAGAVVYVGTDGEKGSSGVLVSKLTVSNGAVFVGDPAWTQKSSLSVHEKISSALTGTPDGVINGGGFVAAMNNYTVLGMTQAEAQALAERHPLSEKGLQSMLAIGQKLTLKGGAGLVVSGKTGTEAAKLLSADTVYLDKGTALYYTEGAATGSTAGITVDNNQGKVQAAGGEIIVGGNIHADTKLNLMANKDGSAVTITGAGDNTKGEIRISSENGLFGAVVDSTTSGGLSGIGLTLSEDARDILHELSDPLYSYVMDIYNDSELSGDGITFVRDQMGKHNGAKTIESAARLASFSGVAQGTMMASQTTSDLISERMGVAKANSALIYADNADVAGIWLAPVYKHQESDSFDADGRDYGADIDLYGVGMGADYTLSNGLRFGGMFNIGSGDADGQGNGSLADNDFDYWSVGAYAGFSYAQASFSADISYTQTDNDLGGAGLDANTDASVFSMGLTGQYKFETSMLDITPHLGVRYSRLDTDDYSVKFDGTKVADVDVDAANVFSIPVGVTLSTEVSAGDWNIKPVFDVTLTANCGDTDQDSDVVFTGADFGQGLSAEFLDDFTYGATAGVAVSNGSLSFGVNAAYVGSENTDEFGVSANLRFMF